MCLFMYLEKEDTVNTITVNSQTSPAQLKTGEELEHDSFISASRGSSRPTLSGADLTHPTPWAK